MALVRWFVGRRNEYVGGSSRRLGERDALIGAAKTAVLTSTSKHSEPVSRRRFQHAKF